MPTFITPYSGSAELTASNGLTVIDQGRWFFNRQGFADGATFGLSLSWPTAPTGDFFYDNAPYTTPPHPQSGGILHLTAENWTIAVIGNELQSYTDPETMITYTADQCRIIVRGYWQVIRQQNSNSFNSFNIQSAGITETDLGSRDMDPWLLSYDSPAATYVIQGSAVDGGAQNTFSNRLFYSRVTEEATTTNSNKEFQSNTITRPTWVYTYSMSWQTD